MDSTVLGAGLCFAAIAVLWSWLSRVKKLEASLDELRQWHGALMWRVYALETSGVFQRPSTAYRTTADEQPRERVEQLERVERERPMAMPAPAPEQPLQPEAQAKQPAQGAPLFPPDTPPQTGASVEPREPQPAIDWERWIGVRGAAALGAGILVIALLYFLSYSIDAGWLTIGIRVVLGALVSCVGLGVAELRLKKTHVVLASWVAGASIAGLYASVWAGEHLASFYGPFASFALVVAVTVLAIALALRDDSLPIALLGVSGAFAAPMSLALSDAAPGGIIAYVAVLDIAMVTLAIRRRWFVLALVALGASSLYEAMWIHSGNGVSPAIHAGLLVVLAGIFGALPAFAMGEVEEGAEAPAPLARAVRFASVLVPLAFALEIAASSPASPLPVAALSLGVAAVAIGIAVRRNEHVLARVAMLLAIVVLLIASSVAVAPGDAMFSVAVATNASLAAVVVGRFVRPLRHTELGSGLVFVGRVAPFLVLIALMVHADRLGLATYAAFAALLVATLVAARPERALAPFSFLLAVSFAVFELENASSLSTSVHATVAAFGAAMVLVPFLPFTGLLASARGPRAQALTIAMFGLVIGVPLVDRHIFAVGLVLAAAALVSALVVAAVHLATDVEPAREGARRYVGTLALATLTGSLVLSFDHEVLTCCFAVLGVALVALSRRLHREALAAIGLLYLGAAALRLLNPDVLSYHARGSVPVFDWITPTYLIPAACALGAYRLLKKTDATPMEALLRKVAATIGLGLTFAWLNVGVLDVFSSGELISLESSKTQARDLAMSFTWALFGIALLFAGMARGSGALRKASLVIVLTTSAKVFLYDLAALGSLYRVASLVGLAASLIGISVLYQRFIFTKPAPAPARGA